MPAAATPCAPSPACRRSSAPGAIRRAARCCRRRAPIPSTTAALERPDLIRGTPRTINMSTIGDALLDAQRPADPRDLRLQLESGRGGARVGEGRGGLRARGSLLRRARDLPDRHRRLRGHPAAGDHAARAAGRPQLVRPPLRAREQSGDRAARRGEAQYRGVPPARRAHGICRALLSRHRRRPRAAGVPVGPSARGGHRLGRR